MTSLPTVTLEKPQSVLSQAVSLNVKNLIVKAVKGFASGNPATLIDILTDVGLKANAEQLAWGLVYQSLANSVQTLVVNSMDLFDPKPTEAQTAELAQLLDQCMTTKSYAIDERFFERPGDFVLLKDFNQQSQGWFADLGLTPGQIDALGFRLASEFTLALHQQWLTKSTEYGVILTQLASPFSQSSRQQISWRNYGAWLEQQVNQRLFHEAFSLKQIYVSPRAYYEDKQTNKKNVVDLHQTLIHWALHFDQNDAIKVVSGGPGAGKSSMAKILAAELSHRCHYPVLFIPLHHFDPSADLIAAVAGFINKSAHLSGSPLAIKEGEPRLLLIFDGLDELAQQGQIGADIAHSFVDNLIRELIRHNSQGLQRQVILTGRDLVIQSNREQLRKPQQIYQLLPYYLDDHTAKKLIFPENIKNNDLRDLWWHKYGQASGKDYTRMPEALKIEQLVDLTAQPLLNYLVALSFERGQIHFDEQTSLNEIYRDLLSAVYERQYDSSGTHGAAKGLTETQFFKVLEEIALAIWHGDGRTASIARINQQCINSKVERYLNAFAASAESGITRLLTAFYFRQADHVQQGDKTFEFTHKSFGEYLTARRLVTMLARISTKLDQQQQDPEEGWDLQEALQQLAELCGPMAIDPYLYRFISAEIALAGQATCQQWQLQLCQLVEASVKWGLPMEKLNLKNYQTMVNQARNANEALLALLCACAHCTKTISTINWPSPTAFGHWFRQLQGQRDSEQNPLAYDCLAYLDMSNCSLDMQNLRRANFYKSDLSEATLYCSVMAGANLEGADLEGADLHHANLQGANLQDANLKDAHLQGADLQGTYLIEADLLRANLQHADLQYADLQGANLQNADLQNADLQGADLQDADLQRANLQGANLQDANLKDANLKGVIFDRRQLSKEQKKQIIT